MKRLLLLGFSILFLTMGAFARSNTATFDGAHYQVAAHHPRHHHHHRAHHHHHQNRSGA